MFVLNLPEIGEGVLEGEVVRWLVAQGDQVSEDQPVCEIMTDKATVEISTPKAGTVSQLYAEEGDVVKIHAPLLDIETGTVDATNGAGTPAPVEAAPEPAKKAAPEPAKKAAPPKPAKKAAAPKPTSKATAPVSAAPALPPSLKRAGRVLTTPAVRRHARELGVDLERIVGSGKGGRVTRADVDAFKPGTPAAPTTTIELPLVAAVPSGSEERVKIIGLRRKIAEQMLSSVQQAPHFTYVEEVDVTRLVRLRAELKPFAAQHGVRLTYLPFIMKALSRVFRAFPNVNANVEEDPLALVIKGDVNIGVATDSPDGLFVPVVKNVEQKSVLQIAAEAQDLAARTREGKVKLEELQGGTFTVTSVGNIGGMLATPIINHPEVAILGVNQIKRRPVVVNEEIVIRDMLYLSPSFDHRIIDGAVGARFTAALKQVLEAPAQLLVEDA